MVANIAPQDDLVQAIESCLDEWKSLPDQIVAANITLINFQQDHHPSPPDHQDWSERIHIARKAGTPDKTFDYLVHEAWPDKKIYRTVNIAIEGGKVTNKFSDGYEMSYDGSTEVRKSDLGYHDNVELRHGRSGWKIIELGDLRYVPYMRLGSEALTPTSKFDSDGMLVIRTGPSLVQADPITAFVTHYRVEREDGTPYTDIYHMCPHEFPGKVVLPLVTVSIRYDKTGLQSSFKCSRIKIDSTTVNQEVDPNLLAVGVDGRSVIVDYRNNTNDPKLYSLNEETKISDVKSVDLKMLTNTPSTPTATIFSNDFLIWSLITTSILLGIATVLIYRVRMIRKSHTTK